LQRAVVFTGRVQDTGKLAPGSKKPAMGPGEVKKDEEGLATLKTPGMNMARLMKKREKYDLFFLSCRNCLSLPWVAGF
jgi:hypothetical protein